MEAPNTYEKFKKQREDFIEKETNKFRDNWQSWSEEMKIVSEFEKNMSIEEYNNYMKVKNK